MMQLATWALAWHSCTSAYEDDVENDEGDVENDKDDENDDNCALVVPLVKRQVATGLLAWQPVLLRTTLYLSPSFLPSHRDEDKDNNLNVIKRK